MRIFLHEGFTCRPRLLGGACSIFVNVCHAGYGARYRFELGLICKAVTISEKGRRLSWLGEIRKLISPPDIYDAAYIYSSEEMNISSLPASALQKKGLITRLAAFFYWMLREIRLVFASRRAFNTSILSGRIVYFYSSLNEKRALEGVASLTENSVMVSMQPSDPSKLGCAIPYVLAIVYAPWVAVNYLVSSGYRKKSYAYALDQYLFSCGYVIYLRFILSKNRPLLAVVSNDHSMLPRSFALVCRELNIPVAYLQHASVSEKFPKLIFDYAFLDGLDALDKYRKKGLGACAVFLSGISKLDSALVKLNESLDKRKRISICPNSMDDVESVMKTAEFILKHVESKYEVCLRPHPGDKRRFQLWEDAAKQIGVLYSAPEVECSTDLILKSCFIVAADSNILLEAALLKAIPISMPFTEEIMDYYGFIRKGVALYAKNPAGAVEIISNVQSSDSMYRAAKYFSQTVGSSYEGSTSKLIALTIIQLATGGRIPEAWSLCSDGIYEVH